MKDAPSTEVKISKGGISRERLRKTNMAADAKTSQISADPGATVSDLALNLISLFTWLAQTGIKTSSACGTWND